MTTPSSWRDSFVPAWRPNRAKALYLVVRWVLLALCVLVVFWPHSGEPVQCLGFVAFVFGATCLLFQTIDSVVFLLAEDLFQPTVVGPEVCSHEV